jgi:hypothetical protein
VEGGGIDIKRDSPDCTLHHLPHTSTLSIKKKKGGTRRILALPAGDLGKWRSMQVALMCVQKRVDGEALEMRNRFGV